MKVINDIVADISEFDQECARHEYTDTDEVWQLLHSIKGRLNHAQGEWIVYFWLEGTHMSAKVQAINSADACEMVDDMFPGREVDYTDAARTHEVSGPSCS